MNIPDLPIIKPIMLLLKSRKFITGVLVLLVSLAITAVPSLEAVREPLLQVVVFLGLSIIGGIAWEDSAAHARQVSTLPVKSINEQLNDLGKTAVDVVLSNDGTNPQAQVTVSGTNAAVIPASDEPVG